jgi:hypothetical protein
MPMCLTVTGLETNNEPRLKKHHWEVDLAYRNLYTPDFYVGTAQHETAAAFRRPVYRQTTSKTWCLVGGVCG